MGVWVVLLLCLMLLSVPASAQEASVQAEADTPLTIRFVHEQFFGRPGQPINLSAEISNTLPYAIENIFVELSLPNGVELAYPNLFTERVTVGRLSTGRTLPLLWPLRVLPDFAHDDPVIVQIEVEAGDLYARSTTTLHTRRRSPALGYLQGDTFIFIDGLGNGAEIGRLRARVPGGLPVVGDWDGDGYDGFGLYADGQFFLYNDVPQGDAGQQAPDLFFPFGEAISGAVPLAGDWDGDGVDSVGLYADGMFYLRTYPTGGRPDLTLAYGVSSATLVPVVGDWNGDGVDTIGVYDQGFFLLRNNNTEGGAEIAFPYGDPGGVSPLIGDWDGDGSDSIGVRNQDALLLSDALAEGDADIAFAVPQGFSRASILVGYWAGTSD